MFNAPRRRGALAVRLTVQAARNGAQSLMDNPHLRSATQHVGAVVLTALQRGAEESLLLLLNRLAPTSDIPAPQPPVPGEVHEPDGGTG